MKGVIFNLLEEVVADAYGERAWDAALDRAGLDGVYTSLGSYDDAEITALVSVIAAERSVSEGDFLCWFGRRAIPLMAGRWPGFFAPHVKSLPFLRTLNSVIHTEVRKLYSGTYCPHFEFSSPADGSLVIGYRSPRKLCGLAEGFILGAGDHYGEALEVRHLACMHEGADHCRIAVTPP
ncbi:MAG: heme NO-binding domain-containing protein [Actinomycetia bacterium]|nr:heme NO-binding domain-containing protein [Actinomycetes bacterium]